MRQIILLPQAQEDLDVVYDPLFTRLIERLEYLRQFPEFGVSMTGPYAGYRSTVVELFRIIYKIRTSGDIAVAYIRHCRKKPIA